MKGFQVAIITLTAGTFTPGWAAENARGSSVPDLSGFYDSGTRTPEQRPAAFGDRQFLTEAEAEELLKQAAFLQTDENVISDPNRGAPVRAGTEITRSEQERLVVIIPSGSIQARDYLP